MEQYYIEGSGGGGGGGGTRGAAPAAAPGGLRGVFSRVVQGARNLANRIRGR